jgi:hypothetical protein
MMMNWNGFGRKRSLPNFKILSRHSPGWTEENHKNLNQDSRVSLIFEMVQLRVVFEVRTGFLNIIIIIIIIWLYSPVRALASSLGVS